MSRLEVPEARLKPEEKRLYQVEFEKISTREGKGVEMTTRDGLIGLINKTNLDTNTKREVWNFPLSSNPVISKLQFNYLMRSIGLRQANVAKPSESEVQNTNFHHMVKIQHSSSDTFSKSNYTPQSLGFNTKEYQRPAPIRKVPIPSERRMPELLNETCRVSSRDSARQPHALH